MIRAAARGVRLTQQIVSAGDKAIGARMPDYGWYINQLGRQTRRESKARAAI
jgi:hypothetical protein